MNTTDENVLSHNEELQKYAIFLKKEKAKNKQLAEESERLKTLLDREKRQTHDYNREMETEMEKRDLELEKREQEIFELVESKQRLLGSVEKLQAELSDERQSSQALSDQLLSCQKQLQEERNKTLLTTPANETALFDAENKVEELRAAMNALKVDANRIFNENLKLEDSVRQLEEEIAKANEELDSLRSLAECQCSELQRAREQVQELQLQLHELQSGNAPQVAPCGNSLFAEVVDGKERLEKQLAMLHQQNRKLRQELIRTMKLAYENSVSRAAGVDGKVLSGPTLDMFKSLKAEYDIRLNEKQNLIERLHSIEEMEHRHARQWAKENPLEYDIFQENIHCMNMRAKQRAEMRVLQLELREQEVLKALFYEKHRAASMPQLELRIEQMQQTLAHYEKAQLSLDEPAEKGQPEGDY